MAKMKSNYDGDERSFKLPNWMKFSSNPDLVLRDDNGLYLKRWWILPRNKFFGLYFHKIYRSDTDRALHDHPWDNMSFVLKNGYIEVFYGAPKEKLLSLDDQTSFNGKSPIVYAPRKAFSFVRRKAREAHRLIIEDDKSPACTLFFTGRVKREWGFHDKDKWIHWKDFT